MSKSKKMIIKNFNNDNQMFEEYMKSNSWDYLFEEIPGLPPIDDEYDYQSIEDEIIQNEIKRQRKRGENIIFDNDENDDIDYIEPDDDIIISNDNIQNDFDKKCSYITNSIYVREVSNRFKEFIVLSDHDFDIYFDPYNSNILEPDFEIVNNILSLDEKDLVLAISWFKLAIISNRVPSVVMTYDEFNQYFYLLSNVNTDKYIFIDNGLGYIYIYIIDSSYLTLFSNLFIKSEIFKNNKYPKNVLYLLLFLNLYEVSTNENTFSFDISNENLSEFLSNQDIKCKKEISYEINNDKNSQFGDQVSYTSAIETLNVQEINSIREHILSYLDLIYGNNTIDNDDYDDDNEKNEPENIIDEEDEVNIEDNTEDDSLSNEELLRKFILNKEEEKNINKTSENIIKTNDNNKSNNDEDMVIPVIRKKNINNPYNK